MTTYTRDNKYVNKRIFVSHWLNGIRQRAPAHGVEVTLDKEWLLRRLEPMRCEATGLPLQLSRGGYARGANAFAPSVDRILPGEGYTPENCRVVCAAYNGWRSTYSDATILVLARALVSRADTEEG